MLTRRIVRSEDEARIEARATPAECDGLAAAFDLSAVLSAEAALTARPRPKGGLALEGRVAARLRRLCVVTAEFFDQDFDEPVSRRYLPGVVESNAGEVEVGALEEDGPDRLPVEGVDLLELVRETLARPASPRAGCRYRRTRLRNGSGHNTGRPLRRACRAQADARRMRRGRRGLQPC